MPKDVICRVCRGRFTETNDHDEYVQVEGGSVLSPNHRAYNPQVCANGAMIRLKKRYEKLMWSPSWSYDVTQTGDSLECPSCGAPYPDMYGKILTDDQPLTDQPDLPPPNPFQKPVGRRTVKHAAT